MHNIKISLASILLRFTHAIREGDWKLYLSSFAEMLPWFAAFVHINYTRWGTVFLADMKALPHKAPLVHEGFELGDFVMKETNASFIKIPDDQAQEYVNKCGKVAGGLVGIMRTDSTRNRWCLTYNERAQLSEDTKAMFGVVAHEGLSHKDLGKAQLRARSAGSKTNLSETTTAVCTAQANKERCQVPQEGKTAKIENL